MEMIPTVGTNTIPYVDGGGDTIENDTHVAALAEMAQASDEPKTPEISQNTSEGTPGAIPAMVETTHHSEVEIPRDEDLHGTEEADEVASEVSSSTSGSSSHDENVIDASMLDDQELFRAFVLKIERDRNEAERDDPDSDEEKEMKGPSLVKSFVDYVHDLETRMKKVEAKLNIKSKEAINVVKTHVSAFKFETRFYNIMDDLDEYGDFKEERESTSNTFRSQTDSRHFIRVAYTWKEDAVAQPDLENLLSLPDSQDINIFALRISSVPISKFLREIYGTQVERLDLVELISPFRILIRHYSQFRDHLSKLREQLRY
jgi:hypothetical protein